MSKKRKRRRRGFGIFVVLIELLLAIAILLAIAGALAYYLCPLKEVAVEGTDLYSKEEIVGYILDDEYCSNTVYAFLKNKVMPKGDAEFIDSFDVTMTGRNSLTITCNEKPIMGYVVLEDGNFIYFNYDGVIVEISETFIDRGYMRVEGVSCENPVVGDALNIGDDQVGYLASLIKILQKNEIMPQVISYDENGRITLSYETYRISLGSSIYLEEKIDRVLRILPEIEGMYGTLHVENYSNQNTDIVFEKDPEVQE